MNRINRSVVAPLFAAVLFPQLAQAALTVRHFEFGESDRNGSGESAQIGDVVVSTHNVSGEVWLPDDPLQMDLTPNDGTSPVYVEGRAGPGSLAVAFNGEQAPAGLATGLAGENFCSWCDPDAQRAVFEASGGLANGTFNRGFQGWVRADAVGLGLEQLVIADGGGQWGGVGITPDGHWLHISDRNGVREEIDTGFTVEFGQWTHIAEIITGDLARMFVNGIVVDARSIGLGPFPTQAPLVVATREDGRSAAFIGAVDDVKIMLTSAVTGGFDARTDLNIFNGITFSGVRGDIDQDGLVGQADVDIWSDNIGFEAPLVAGTVLPNHFIQFPSGTGANPGALLLGDANENGIIDFADFAIIKHAAAAQGNTIIPEPGTLTLLGLGTVALRLRRR